MTALQSLVTEPVKIIDTWLHRARSREQLKTMSDRGLRDIGLTRWEVKKEIQKPFWVE